MNPTLSAAKHHKTPIAMTSLCCIAAMISLLATAPAFAQQNDAMMKTVAEAKSRGIIGGKLTSDLQTDAVPSPPDGVEVEEYHATGVGGPQDGSMQAWSEPFGDNTLHIEVGHRRDSAAMVSWWVLPKSSRGCLIYVYKIFDASGHLVRSEYWSRTNLIKANTGKDFPDEIYPFGPNGGMPPGEMIRALDPIEKGSSGRVFTQYTYDSYVVLDVWADRIEEVTVPAGDFKALHLTMRPNPETFLPSWPNFVLKIIDQFMPKESFYFEAAPPYRFLKFEGVTGPAGKPITTELARHWTAGKSEVSAR
jgi:hypothetical protein